MTTLTEKLKKGELPDNHHYYFKLPKSKEYEVGNTFCLETLHNCKDGDKIEVLSEVPSYEQWQGLKEFADYSIHNRYELTRQINFWIQENTKLKELLKRAKDVLEDEGDYMIVQEINQVLGADR